MLKALLEIPSEILHSKKLVLTLAKNDFKTKFAGSYLGRIWAFIQPIVTVLVYWFVFEKALNAGTQSTKSGITVPFVLWLIAGLVPWFYFQDILSSGTNVLVEYSYLVKKVVFKISTLPVIKVISNLFVHLFFIAFMLILYLLYGRFPGIYMLQIIYYSFCVIVFATGLIYATSAIVVFFRDLSQIVNIVLQVLIWATPIMWNIDAVSFPPIVLKIIKLNPMYYIVSGYRDSMIGRVWFWERAEITLYFWIVSILIFIVGTMIFRRLRVHFADVL
jgi:teichoic acid transport system permease protein